ncbi:hypothetical protein [Bartonella harrusi]|uniref:Uncharacterized protein n=1 Tax=Bartonella harrusi TaxID=2961895 RepID=A0ABY5ESN9_9HYPH|nr:hypothetical protein [Bartonella harrusi]UTO28147.1 hypothetical protein NMK50_08175 [Bartonella harrusi]UTO28149.1 hypothetical protein NMK50_08185 [Bartonella harrusi]
MRKQNMVVLGGSFKSVKGRMRKGGVCEKGEACERGKLLVGLWGEEVLLARQFCGRRSVWKA